MTRRLAVALACSLALTALGLVACSSRTQSPTPAPQQAPDAVQPTASGQSIVFNMGHGEIFSAEDTSELGQSEAVRRMREAGFDVAINRDSISETDLEGASGLVLAGPMSPLTREEYAAISAFVKKGGTVLLTIHVPFPVMAVPAHWGLPVTPAIIASERPLPGADPGVFIATDVEEGRLTEGVDSVLVVSGWPVSAEAEGAEIVVSGGPDAWIDKNGDAKRTKADGTKPLGVVGAARVGKGYVVVAGDDAIFANVGIGQADNARLLRNILGLMSDAQDL
ncbi:MAG: hypothetical protein HY876_05340 [Coriobacteriales bacterium]|nr:hypothetical protein [Coriobacteriales bacterium]